MKLIKIECEGYGGLNKIFPHGESYYLIENKQLEAFIKRFEEWRNSLGPCTEAVRDIHELKNHVWMNVLELNNLPKFLR